MPFTQGIDRRWRRQHADSCGGNITARPAKFELDPFTKARLTTMHTATRTTTTSVGAPGDYLFCWQQQRKAVGIAQPACLDHWAGGMLIQRVDALPFGLASMGGPSKVVASADGVGGGLVPLIPLMRNIDGTRRSSDASGVAWQGGAKDGEGANATMGWREGLGCAARVLAISAAAGK